LKTKNLVVRVSEEMYNNLEKIATRKGMTLSEIARYALQKLIDEEEVFKMKFIEKKTNDLIEGILEDEWLREGSYEYNDGDIIYECEEIAKEITDEESKEYNEIVDSLIERTIEKLKENGIEVYWQGDIIIRNGRMYNVNERILLRRKIEDQSE